MPLPSALTYPVRLSRGPDCLEIISVLGSGKPQYFAFHNGALINQSDDPARALGSLIRLKRPQRRISRRNTRTLAYKVT